MKTTLLFLLVFFCATITYAQQPEPEKSKNATLEEPITDTLKDFEVKPKASGPTKAALLSAVLPGLGQAYNKKYWKLPLVYGGAVAFGAVIRFNHNQYVRFRNALIQNEDGDPTTISEFPTAEAASIRSVRDNARRNRDYSIILSAVFYGLNIVDAAVDAHLKDFDVSDDISLQVSPTLLPNIENKPIPALSLSVRF